MNVKSWPINCSENEKEFFNGLIGAISAEHLAMYKANVLHRDVSPGITLVASLKSDKNLASQVSDTRAVLIDLDHVKSTDRVKTVGKPFHHTVMKHYAAAIKLLGHDIAEEAIGQAMKLREMGVEYCLEAKKLNVLDAKPEGEWTAKDFGWDDVGKVPDFGSHTSGVPRRTKTMSFITPQLLGSYTEVVHDAIHDMESFLWALVYICHTRESGGEHHREDDIKRKRFLAKLFYATEPGILHYEKYFFFNPGGKKLVKDSLLEHVPKYFEQFKPLILRWRDVLYLGYRFNAFEYYHIHRYFLAVAHEIYDQLPNEDSTTPRPTM